MPVLRSKFYDFMWCLLIVLRFVMISCVSFASDFNDFIWFLLFSYICHGISYESMAFEFVGFIWFCIDFLSLSYDFAWVYCVRCCMISFDFVVMYTTSLRISYESIAWDFVWFQMISLDSQCFIFRLRTSTFYYFCYDFRWCLGSLCCS